MFKIAKWMFSDWERERGSGQRRQPPQTIRVICQRVSTSQKAIAIFNVQVWLSETKLSWKPPLALIRSGMPLVPAKSGKSSNPLTSVVVSGERWTLKPWPSFRWLDGEMAGAGTWIEVEHDGRQQSVSSPMRMLDADVAHGLAGVRKLLVRHLLTLVCRHWDEVRLSLRKRLRLYVYAGGTCAPPAVGPQSL